MTTRARRLWPWALGVGFAAILGFTFVVPKLFAGGSGLGAEHVDKNGCYDDMFESSEAHGESGVELQTEFEQKAKARGALISNGQVRFKNDNRSVALSVCRQFCKLVGSAPTERIRDKYVDEVITCLRRVIDADLAHGSVKPDTGEDSSPAPATHEVTSPAVPEDLPKPESKLGRPEEQPHDQSARPGPFALPSAAKSLDEKKLRTLHVELVTSCTEASSHNEKRCSAKLGTSDLNNLKANSGDGRCTAPPSGEWCRQRHYLSVSSKGEGGLSNPRIECVTNCGDTTRCDEPKGGYAWNDYPHNLHVDPDTNPKVIVGQVNSGSCAHEIQLCADEAVRGEKMISAVARKWDAPLGNTIVFDVPNNCTAVLTTTGDTGDTTVAVAESSAVLAKEASAAIGDQVKWTYLVRRQSKTASVTGSTLARP